MSGADSYKVVVVGAGAVGKSCITLQFVQSQFIEGHDPTIEDSYQKYCTVDERPCRLDIMDTAGQEEFQAMTHQNMRQGQGFLLVFSVSDQASLERAEELREEIVRSKGEDESVPIILVGNKSDLINKRVIKTTDGQAAADRMKASKFIETSAKTRSNIDEAFHELVRLVRKDGALPCQCAGPCICYDKCVACGLYRNKHGSSVEHPFREKKKGFCNML